MTIAEKRQRALSNIPKVYEAGEKAENDRMWNAVLNDGNRTVLTYAFNNWSCEYIRPNRKLVPTDPNSRSSTFSSNFKLKAVEKEYFDFFQCPRGTYASQGWHYTFTTCKALEIIEDIGLCNAFTFNHTFAWCGKLHTIVCIYPDKDTKFDNAFLQCDSLVHLGVNGVIRQDINFSYSPLDLESALSVLTHLYDFRAANDSDEYTKTVYFSDATKALLDAYGANIETDFGLMTWEEYISLKGWLAG